MFLTPLLFLFAAPVQTDTLPNAHVVVKYCPLALVDIYQESYFKGGLEIKIKSSQSVYLEYGQWIRDVGISRGLSDNFGFIASAEWRNYVNGANNLRGQFYGINLQYKQQHYHRRDVVQEQPQIMSRVYKLDKDCYGLFFQFGGVYLHKTGFTFEAVAALGAYIKIVDTNLSQAEAQQIIYGDWTNLFRLYHMNHNYYGPAFQVRLRVGYRLW